jgi:hypothetical protein
LIDDKPIGALMAGSGNTMRFTGTSFAQDVRWIGRPEGRLRRLRNGAAAQFSLIKPA